MVRGKIKWFGGFNRKTGKINDYGFITPEEYEKYGTDIFLHRNDMPNDLQKWLEEDKNKGEGIDLIFEIVPGKTGKLQAFNVKLATFFGVVVNADKGKISIDCEVYPDAIVFSEDDLARGEVVEFGLQHDLDFKRKKAVLVQKIDCQTENWDVIEKYVQSRNPKIFKKFFRKYADGLSVEEYLYFVIEKIKQLDAYAVNELIKEAEGLLLKSSELRQLVLLNDRHLSSYNSFLRKYLNLIDERLRQEIWDEIIAQLKITSESKRLNYWHEIPVLQENLEYAGFLWDVAPVKLKKEVVINKYRKFFEILSEFEDSDYPYAKAITGLSLKLDSFSENEIALIEKWTGKESSKNKGYEMAKMMSARHAEKVAMSFYQQLGYAVKDISIHQVTGKSNAWVKADIRLDSGELLDVKNARKAVNSEVNSTFCVPKFKNNRGKDVKIVGVQSPYNKIKLSSMELYGDNKNPQILGDFDYEKLNRLSSIFNSNLLEVDFSRYLYNKAQFLQHWLFDYEDRFYRKQYQVIAKFQKLRVEELPRWEEVRVISGKNPLPLFIAGRRKLPNQWLNNLPQWQAEFVDSLITIPFKKISLPYLFLSIMRHFLTMLSQDILDYSPLKYLEILYPNNEKVHPLKLYDPLNSIHNFCKTLQTLWEYRNTSNLREFTIFKFDGEGLLKGKKSKQDKYKTLLAYCGGFVENKGKCGYTPLIFGQHETCEKCGYLICPKDDCRCCSINCSSYLERKPKKDDWFYGKF